MSALDRLMDSLRITLPGALDSAIKEELWNCVDEFCRHTDAYRQIVSIPLIVGETLYELEPTNSKIIRLFSITHPTLNVRDAFYDILDEKLYVADTPQAEDLEFELTLEVSLAPPSDDTDPANWVPEEIWSRFYHAFMDGTLGRMHGQAAKPYSAQQKAAYHLSRFRRKMAEARHDSSVGFMAGGQTWRFPRFAR